jgi:hypothetical protein
MPLPRVVKFLKEKRLRANSATGDLRFLARASWRRYTMPKSTFSSLPSNWSGSSGTFFQVFARKGNFLYPS